MLRRPRPRAYVQYALGLRPCLASAHRTPRTKAMTNRTLTVELRGLEVFGHHGATDEEQEAGQTLLWDVEWQVAEPASDELAETVDYEGVAACVREVSDARRYRLLESLAAAGAEAVRE